jgi:hypothetical protein
LNPVRRSHCLLLILAILVLAAVAVPAVAQEDEDAGDQVEGESGEADETEAQGEDEGEDEEEPEERVIPADRPDFVNEPAGGGRGRGQRGRLWDPEFHPAYKLDHKRDQDVVSWGHDFNLTYPMSERISFKATTVINTRENENLNRINRQETYTAALDMAVTDAITTGISFRRIDNTDVANEGAPNESKSFREKENVKLSTAYKKTHLSGVEVSLGATAGLEKNKYANVKSRGSTQSITAGLKYLPIESFSTDFNYTGNHSMLDSKQGELDSTDESIDHSLGGRLKYDWKEHDIAVNLRRSTGKKEYPKSEQTEIRENENESAGVTTNLTLLEGLTTKLTFDYSHNESYYRVQPSRNSDLRTRSVSADLDYTVGETKFQLDLRSEKKRSDYFSVQTGDNYTNSLIMQLSQALGEAFDAKLVGRMSLLSVQYDDIESNDQDRDLYDRNAALTLNYRVRHDITTGMTVRVAEDQLIYIRRTRTADNKTTQTYSVEPFVRKSFSPRFSLDQRYSLSADYTFYQFDENSNFLIRTLSVKTGATWKPFGAFDLNITHGYTIQDEGGYVKDAYGVEKYGKASERIDQKLAIRVRYKLADVVDIEVKQELGVQDKWNIVNEKKVHTWDRFDTSVVGSARTRYTLPDGTTLEGSIARTHRDATNISDSQREIWNISLRLGRTF